MIRSNTCLLKFILKTSTTQKTYSKPVMKAVKTSKFELHRQLKLRHYTNPDNGSADNAKISSHLSTYDK